ncbi:MraY family glycosyltransferase [Pseudomonadota bacterium]
MSAHPGGHRLHASATPLVGGIGMFLGLTFGFLLINGPMVLWSCALIVVVAGVWDDIHELSTGSRFLAQIIAAAMMIYWGDVILVDLGYLVSDDSLFYLGRWAVALSIFGSVGIMNATNMSDGIDGLAGSLTFVSASAILVAAGLGGIHQSVTEIGVFLSVIAAFLWFNLRLFGNKPARVFMGDAGSLLLGLFLAWYLIKHSQEPNKLFSPVTALWIAALPLFDAVGVLFRRAIKGQSPFSADRSHYHHYLLEMGLSVNQVLLVAVTASVLFAAIGLSAHYAGVPEQFMFYAFLLLFFVYLFAMEMMQRKLEY